jgi:hypothetical protein
MRIAFNTPAKAAREITHVWGAKGTTTHARPYTIVACVEIDEG